MGYFSSTYSRVMFYVDSQDAKPKTESDGKKGSMGQCRKLTGVIILATQTIHYYIEGKCLKITTYILHLSVSGPRRWEKRPPIHTT